MLRRRKRKKRPAWRPPPLTIRQILEWADDFFERRGRWPTESSGRIPGAFGTTWHAVDSALRTGSRGLESGSSLPRLLAEHRGRRNHLALPPFDQEQILAWGDAYFARTGAWPDNKAG